MRLSGSGKKRDKWPIWPFLVFLVVFVHKRSLSVKKDLSIILFNPLFVYLALPLANRISSGQ